MGSIGKEREIRGDQEWAPLLSLTLFLRLTLGLIAAGLVVWLPGGEPEARSAYLLITLGAYLPYAAVVYALRGQLSPSVWYLTAIGDLAFVFALSVFVSPARSAALFGYLLLVAVYTAIAGVRVGATVAGVSIALAQVGRALAEPAGRIDQYTHAAHAIVLVALMILVDVATRERRRALRSELSEKASELSHEMRLPLVAIAKFSEILLDRWDSLDHAQRRETLEAIAVNAEEANHLAETFIGPAMVSAPLYPQPVEMMGFVRSFIQRHGPAFQSKRIVITTSQAHTVIADVAALDRILGNLLVNAAEHSPPGSKITVAAAPSGADLKVEITNAAFPMKLGEVDDATGPRSGRPRRGGLGLAICRSYLRRMGGALQLDRIGDTVTATFTLPLEVHTAQTSDR